MRNVSPPIYVSVSGRDISVKEVQLENAPPPKYSNLLGNVMFFKCLSFLNA